MTNFKKPISLLAIAFLGLITSCTQEEERWTNVKADPTEEIITDRSNNRIISFKVVNSGEAESIYSTIDDINKTITIYLPSYYEYQSLNVKIELPEGTNITPAEDVLIPVFGTDPVIYTVTAADGTTAIYNVTIIIQQPELLVNEFTDTTPVIPVYGNGVTVTGQNFVPSYAATKLFIVDAQGAKIYEMQHNDDTDIFSFSATYVFGLQPGDASPLQADTDYFFRMESYSLNYTTHNPFRLQF